MNTETLAKLVKKKRGVKGVPAFLPFRTIGDLDAFDAADEDTFNELV